jgi:hypothetical protein
VPGANMVATVASLRSEPMTELPGLSPASFHPATETAQRFLASAFDSVDSMLENQVAVQQMAEDEAFGGDHEYAARAEGSSQDMLRAIIVFAGAGLDAAIKQLIRDTLPSLLEVNEQAQEKFIQFAETAITDATATIATRRRLARYLVATSPRTVLAEDYIHELTGYSLQSVEQVNKAMGALGLADAALRRRAAELGPLFAARNEIVHELDLLRPERHGERHRRLRTVDDSITMAHIALEVGQLIINGVAALLQSQEHPDGQNSSN